MLEDQLIAKVIEESKADKRFNLFHVVCTTVFINTKCLPQETGEFVRLHKRQLVSIPTTTAEWMDTIRNEIDIRFGNVVDDALRAVKRPNLTPNLC